MLPDVGIWFHIESHSEHHCDVLVLNDYVQSFEDLGHISFKTPSGMVDGRQNSLWDLQFSILPSKKKLLHKITTIAPLIAINITLLMQNLQIAQP